MAIQATKGVWWMPHWTVASTSVLGFTVTAIDAAADRVAAIFRAPKALTIDQILVSIGSITTSANLDFRIETVQTTGAATPTGTLWAANTAAANLVPAANTVLAGTLTASASVTRGQVFAVVVQENGAAAINLNINGLATTSLAAASEFPYGSLNTTGAYVNGSTMVCCAVHDSVSGEWIFLDEGAAPIQSFSANAFNTGTGATTGTRRGVRFRIPFPGTLGWSRWKASTATTTGDFTVDLYSDAGSLIATLATIDANQRRASAGNGQWDIVHDADASLAANTWYRLVLTPTTANSVTLTEIVLNAAAHQDAMPLGQNFHACRFISSAWSDATAERPQCSLGLVGFDDAVSTTPIIAGTTMLRGMVG